MGNPDPEPCGHRLADRDLPVYCTVVSCRNYIARTDMWNALNGWRFTGPVDNPLPAPEHNDGETKTLDA